MSVPNPESRHTQDLSWSILLAVAAVIVGSLWLLRYNVIYTEGEVMQSLFTGLVGLVGACVLLGFRSRRTALWCITLAGGLPLLWQAYENRKWAIIHEDVVAIVRFAEDMKSRTGHYPKDLGG
jgi:hypothetical protein